MTNVTDGGETIFPKAFSVSVERSSRSGWLIPASWSNFTPSLKLSLTTGTLHLKSSKGYCCLIISISFLYLVSMP
jgi:hypothetical protein